MNSLAKKLAFLALLVILAIVFLNLNTTNGKKDSQGQVSLSPTPSESETKEERIRRLNRSINTGDIPECYLGRCPEYLDQTWYVFPEGAPGASVVIVPTAMTKGAGEVWVIRWNKVLYKTSTLAEISAWLENKNDESHLFISYVSEWKDGVYPSIGKVDELLYKSGDFELVNVSTSEIGAE